MNAPKLQEEFWKSSEYEFWKIVLETLLVQTLWKEKPNTNLVIFKENEFSAFLEDCVAWEFPNMKKEIIRNPNKKIEEIQFSIGNVRVITLKKHYATFYINILNDWYSFYSKETLSKRLYQFLQAFPSFYTEGVVEYRKFLQKIQKKQKKQQIAQDSIRLVIGKMMKENDYHLQFQTNSCALKVKMKKKQVLEMNLPYQTFTNLLDKIMDTLKLAENLIETAKMKFTLSGSGYYVEWHTTVQEPSQSLQIFPDFYSQSVAEFRKMNKQYKMRQIAQDSIRISIDKMMKENGYLYNLKFKSTTCVLRVKMKKKQILEMNLPYKTFTNRLDKIIPTIKLVEQNIATAKMRFTISNYGYYVNWEQTKK